MFQVAPYTGAWIEILLKYIVKKSFLVAPYTGAWIEIETISTAVSNEDCRTLHGCVD